MKNHAKIWLSGSKRVANCCEHSTALEWVLLWQTYSLKTEAQLPGIFSTAAADRASLIPCEGGTDGNMAACALREFSDRPPETLADANCAAAIPPPPDNLWFVRLAAWQPTSRTQPRSGGSQPAGGGTIFFQGADEFAVELHSNPRLGLESPDAAEQEREPRVVLWMRSGDPTLRAVTMDEKPWRKSSKMEPEKIELASEAEVLSMPDCQGILAFPPPVRDTACPLLVWTLWTNPLFPNLLCR